MLIVCPSCASRYSIDDEKIGADGRTVRCASCRHDFFVRLGDDAPAPPPSATPASNQDDIDAMLAAEFAAASEAAPTDGMNEAASTEVDPLDQAELDRLFEAEMAAARQEAGSDLAPPPPPARVKAEKASGWRRFLPWRKRPAPGQAKAPKGRRPAAHGKRPGKPGSKASGPPPDRRPLYAGAACLVLLAALVWQRETVVRLQPASASLFAAIGLPVNLRGLAFADIRPTVQTEGGTRLLLVEGAVRNLRGSATPVPLIEISVRGEEGRSLYTWTTEPPRSTLGPGEALHFRARLATPPEAGRNIEVRFTDRTRNAAAQP